VTIALAEEVDDAVVRTTSRVGWAIFSIGSMKMQLWEHVLSGEKTAAAFARVLIQRPEIS